MRICQKRHSDTKTGAARFPLAVLTLLVVIASGCGSDEALLEKAEVARKHLQLSQDEEALSVLSSVDGASAPPEFRYLKSLTLYRLGRTEAAGSEIALAMEAAPENPKYKGMQLLLRLMARDRDSMDQLIELNEKYAAVGAVAFFATYGFHAKADILHQANKPKSADYHSSRSRQTLDTAMTLRDSIAEFHPDLFRMAMLQQRHQPALEILDGLLKLDPESSLLKTKKVKVLALLKQNDEAAQIAGEIFAGGDKQEDQAEFYATALSQANGSEKHDSEFSDLLRQFGRNTVVASKYAIYLARTNRLEDAERHLETSIDKQKSAEAKEALAFVAITLPLEGKAPDMAETRLRQYRPLLTDPLLVEYFEARILYLRKQYREAIRRLLHIVEIARKQGPGSHMMAKEALVWVRNILADKLIVEQMQNALEAANDRKEKPEGGPEEGVKPDGVKIEPGVSPDPKPKTDPPAKTDSATETKSNPPAAGNVKPPVE